MLAASQSVGRSMTDCRLTVVHAIMLAFSARRLLSVAHVDWTSQALKSQLDVDDQSLYVVDVRPAMMRDNDDDTQPTTHCRATRDTHVAVTTAAQQIFTSAQQQQQQQQPQSASRCKCDSVPHVACLTTNTR